MIQLTIAEPVAEAVDMAPEISEESELLMLETTDEMKEPVGVLKMVEMAPVVVMTWDPLVMVAVPLTVEMGVPTPPVPVSLPAGPVVLGPVPEGAGPVPAADDRTL